MNISAIKYTMTYAKDTTRNSILWNKKENAEAAEH